MDLVISTLSIFTRYLFLHSTGDSTPLQPCLHLGAEHLDVSEDASPLRLPYRVDSTLDPLPLWQPGESLGHCIVTADSPSAPAGFQVLSFHNVVPVIICVPATLVRMHISRYCGCWRKIAISHTRMTRLTVIQDCVDQPVTCRESMSSTTVWNSRPSLVRIPVIPVAHELHPLQRAAPFDNARTLPGIHAKVPCGHCQDVAPPEIHFRSANQAQRFPHPVPGREPPCMPAVTVEQGMQILRRHSQPFCHIRPRQPRSVTCRPASTLAPSVYSPPFMIAPDTVTL